MQAPIRFIVSATDINQMEINAIIYQCGFYFNAINAGVDL